MFDWWSIQPTTVNHNQQRCIDNQYNQQCSNTTKWSIQSTIINHSQQWTTNDIGLIVNTTNNGQLQPQPTTNNKLQRRIELQYNWQPNTNNGQPTTFDWWSIQPTSVNHNQSHLIDHQYNKQLKINNGQPVTMLD